MVWSIVLGIIICFVLALAAKQSPKIADDFFGQLSDEVEDFLGNKYFKPVEKAIEVFIEKDTLGLPTNEQKSFFKKVESEYDLLIAKMIPLIENEVKNWQPDFKIKDFKSEFLLHYMMIPKSDNREWELAFNSIHDQNHTYTVYFSGFEPKSILIDG